MYNKSLEMNFVLDLCIKKIIKIMPFFQPLEWHYLLKKKNFNFNFEENSLLNITVTY